MHLVNIKQNFRLHFSPSLWTQDWEATFEYSIVFVLNFYQEMWMNYDFADNLGEMNENYDLGR